MKIKLISRLLFRAMFCISMILMAVSAYSQESVKLQYQFKSGDITRYKVKEKITCNKKLASIDFNSDWDAILKIEILDVKPDGVAEIKTSYESGTLKIGGLVHQITQEEVAPVILKVTKEGKILNFDEIVQANTGMVNITTRTEDDGGWANKSIGQNVYHSILRSFWQEIPSRELKQGEKWEQAVLSPLLQGTMNARYELKSLNDHFNGSKVVSISSNINEKSPAEKAGGIEGNIKEKSKILFSSEKGQIASIENQGTLQIRGVPVETIENQKMDMNMDINYKTQIQLM